MDMDRFTCMLMSERERDIAGDEVERQLVRQAIYLQMQRTYHDADKMGRTLSALEEMQSRASSKPSMAESATVAALDAAQKSVMRMAGVMAILAWSQGSADEKAIPLPSEIQADMRHIRSMLPPAPEKQRSRMTSWIIRLLEASLRWLQTR
jgi:hypothetical protein